MHQEMHAAILRRFHPSHFRRNNHPIARRPAPHFCATPEQRGGGAEFAPDGRCSAHVAVPRHARREATANRRSNCLRSDRQRAKIDDFCALRAHGVAGYRAPSSATPRGEARNVVHDEC